MGVRIHVYLSHDLPRFDDAAVTLARLNTALPMALAVREYWRRIDNNDNELDHWRAEPVTPRTPSCRRYEGPGCLWLNVTPAAARIYTGARWAGFLTIDPLRQVHLAAFRAIARALGSTTMAVCADARDDVSDVFLEKGSLADCIAQLKSAMGPPQTSFN